MSFSAVAGVSLVNISVSHQYSVKILSSHRCLFTDLEYSNGLVCFHRCMGTFIIEHHYYSDELVRNHRCVCVWIVSNIILMLFKLAAWLSNVFFCILFVVGFGAISLKIYVFMHALNELP